MRTHAAAVTILAILAVLAVASPSPARAYAVTGHARLERMDAAVAWKDGTEVLVLSPVVASAEAGSFVVVPLPAGAELVTAPPLAIFDAGGDAAATKTAKPGAPPAGKAAPKAGAGARVARGVATGPAANARAAVAKVRLGVKPLARGPLPVVTHGEVTMLEGRGAAALPALRGLIGNAAFDALPKKAMAAYEKANASFAVLSLAPAQSPVRVSPVAFRFAAAKRLVVPVRLAEGTTPHTLGIVVVGPRPLSGLAGMDVALGLRRLGPPSHHLAPALATWLEHSLGLATASVERLTVPRLAGPHHPLAHLPVDLVLLPAHPAAKRAASSAAPAAAGPSRLALEVSLGAALVVVLGLLAWWRRRRV